MSLLSSKSLLDLWIFKYDVRKAVKQYWFCCSCTKEMIAWKRNEKKWSIVLCVCKHWSLLCAYFFLFNVHIAQQNSSVNLSSVYLSVCEKYLHVGVLECVVFAQFLFASLHFWVTVCMSLFSVCALCLADVSQRSESWRNCSEKAFLQLNKMIVVCFSFSLTTHAGFYCNWWILAKDIEGRYRIRVENPLL